MMTAHARANEADTFARLDWGTIATALDERGCAHVSSLLTADECVELAAMYEEDARFRSTIVMARHNFGRGEYRYFTYPLPPLVQRWREALYPPLAMIANEWQRRLRIDRAFPATHREFLAQCHAAAQTRPTPLLLRYTASDYNCLHQDLYGDCVFPLQVAILLSQPARDFTGGEFVLTEQRPRMQSRVEVVPLQQGDAVVFAVHERPVSGARGIYRVKMRHGVSRIRTGLRHTLGLIFHDDS